MFFNFLSNGEAAQFAKIQIDDPANAINYQLVFDGMEEVRKSIFRADALRSFIFVLLGGALIWVYSLKKLPKTAFLIIFGILIVVDIIPVDKRYLSDKKYQRIRKTMVPFPATAADLQIMQDKDPDYRVLNLTVGPWQDASTSYYHKSIGGYHGAKFRRYQDLIDYHLGKFNMEVINMLNTRYFIQKGQNGQPAARPNYSALGNAWFVNDIKWVKNADEEITYLGKVLKIENLAPSVSFKVYGRPLKTVDTIMMTIPIKLMAATGDKTVEEIDLSRLNLLPHQTYILGYNLNDTTPNFVNLSEVKNADLLAPQQFRVTVISSFDARNQAIIDRKFKNIVGEFKPQTMANATINLVSYEPNHLVYESNAEKEGLAVFSEIYYPVGWTAYIDGKETPYFRTNYVLRGMIIPEGKHQVEFKFHPNSYYIGKKVSFGSSLLIFILLLWLAWKEFEKRKKVEE